MNNIKFFTFYVSLYISTLRFGKVFKCNLALPIHFKLYNFSINWIQLEKSFDFWLSSGYINCKNCKWNIKSKE